MKNPLVSVVMPVFNGDKFLYKAIKSVSIQKIDLELIVVDDCSTDNSMNIILDCKEKFPHIDFVIEKMPVNSGVSKCRNKGISLAKGKYIAFLDCDDIWTKGKLLAQIKIMEIYKCPVCCTGRKLIDINGKDLEIYIPVKENISYKNLLLHNSINMSSAIVLTEIAKKFPMTSKFCHEDYVFWLSILKEFGHAKGINKAFLIYRKNINSKSGNKIKSAKMHYNSLRVHKIKPIKAFFLLIPYFFNGIMKHRGLK